MDMFEAAEGHIETALASAWSDALGIERIGARDNYFELGGDSITAIHIVALAARHGVKITMRQIFERPTVRELAQVAADTDAALRTETPGSGPATLTPIQHWFFSEQMPEPDYWNTEVAFAVPAQPAAVECAVDLIVAHHDALRMRYQQHDDGWEQYNADAEAADVYELHDLSPVPVDELSAEMARIGSAAHDSLSLEAGPLVRAVHFLHDETGLSRLLLVVHHLVVDGVSLRIIQDDLQSLLRQSSVPAEPVLTARTTSFQEWGRRLGEYAGSADLAAELPYWRRLLDIPVASIPCDSADGSDDRAAAQVVTVSIDSETTRQLLVDVARIGGSQINDALLSALSAALRDWCGGPVRVDVEGHGREDLFDDVDLSRTVGWFTSVFPMILGRSANGSPLNRLTQMKDELRQVPHHGIGYGILRYLAEERTRAEMAAIPAAQIGFNYLGRFERHAEIDSAVAVPTIARSDTRSYPLEINGSVQDGCLHFDFTYSAGRHRRETIAALAASFVDEVVGLVDACIGAGMPDSVDAYPLSPIQLGMLYHTVSEPAHGYYIVQQIEKLDGQADLGLLEKAWQLVIDRHPVLRTSFRWDDVDNPLQLVRAAVAAPFEVVDLRRFDPDRRQAMMDDHRSNDVDRGFDLSTAPLARIVVFRLTDRDHRMMLTIHHIITDQWSGEILTHELANIYTALRAGTAPDLTPAVSDRAYLDWLADRDVANSESFWRRYLDGFDEPTELGRFSDEPAIPLHVEETVDAALTAAIEQFAGRNGLTLNTVVQGALLVLVSSYTRRQDVCVAVASAGRPAEIPGVDRMIGNLVATTPLRMELDADAPMVTWLHRVQELQTEVRQHEFVGLARIQALSPLGSGRPLTNALLLFQNVFTSDNGVFEPDVVWERTHFPFALTVTPAVPLELSVAYDPNRFGRDEIVTLIEHLRVLLRYLASAPECRVEDLMLLLDDVHRDEPAEWTNGRADLPVPELTMSELIEIQARSRPDAIAVVDGAAEIPYRDLNALANQLAALLRTQGIGHEDRVGVCFARSVEMVVAVLAVLKVGAAYVPVDPATPDDRVAFMFGDAAVRLVLTHSSLAPRMRGLSEQVICLDADAERIARYPSRDEPQVAGPDSLAYVIYTSGSSGQPKGVMVEHHSLTNYAVAGAAAYGMTGDDRVLQFMPLSFDWSHDETFVPLYRGATIVLRTDAMADSVEEYLSGCERLGVTITNLPSAFWHVVAEAVLNDDRRLPGSVRVVSIGGESVNAELVRSWKKALPDVTMLNGYGPTEATCGSTLCDVSATDIADGEIPIGLPLANVQAHVFDARMQPVPIGAIGELYLGGAGIARGYLNQPELTAAAFLDDPASPGHRMYKTGDLVRRRTAGQLEFIGRADDQIKIRGYRIELGEIEIAVTRHPAVSQCAVVVHEGDTGSKQLVAHVVPHPDDLSYADLATFVAQWLPQYMVPSAVVSHRALPHTANGKVDRRALQRVEPGTATTSPDSAPAAGSLEQILCQVWAEVLGVDQVGLDDDFFDLGGDSILSLRIVSRSKRMGIALTARDLFANPTVRELAGAPGVTLADAAEDAAGSDALLDDESLQRVGVGRPGVVDAYPCAPAQLGMLFHSLYEAGSGAYVNQSVLELADDVDVDVLVDAWRLVVSRHAVLRSAFVWTKVADPVQVVHESVELPFVVLPGATDLAEFLAADLVRGFDLGSPPLMRLTLLVEQSGARRLVWTWHHMILDGWSGDLVVNEVAVVYRALRSGIAPRLPVPPAYREFIAWLGRQDLGAAEVFWRKELAGFTEPTRWGVPGAEPGEHRVLVRSLAADRTEEVMAFAREHRLTFNTVIQGAFALLLSGYTGARDVCFGVVSAGRPADLPGVETTVGMCVATTPLRVVLDPEQTIVDMLTGLQNGQLVARRYEHAPLTKIQSWSPLGAGKSLFDTLLAVNDQPAGNVAFAQLEGAASGPTGYPLSVSVTTGESLRMAFGWQSGVFADGAVERLADDFMGILHHLISSPLGRLDGTPTLYGQDYAKVVVDWNQTEQDVAGADRTVSELFEAQARIRPQAPSVVYEGGHLTYEQLNARSNQLARHLRSLGVEPDSRVAVFCDRSPEMLIAVLGVLKAGGAYVPIDPQYDGERNSRMLIDSGAQIVLSRADLTDRFDSTAVAVVDLDQAWILDHYETGDLTQNARPDNLVYVAYTSGSTGTPKGVMIEHRALSNYVPSAISKYSMTAGDRMLQFGSLAFDWSVFEIFLPLCCGAAVVLRTEEMAESFPAFVAGCNRESVSIFSVPSQFWHIFTDLLASGDLALPEAVRAVSIGGDRIDPARVRTWQNLFGDRLPLFNGYGPTEATCEVATLDIAGVDVAEGEVPIGRPYPNTQAYVLDDWMRPRPIGEPGELYLGGTALARGYLGRPDLTAEAFVDSPFRPGERLYKTGDRARFRHDGHLEVIGRLDSQLKIRGYRVEPGEIEGVLGEHPLVGECAVVATQKVPRRLIGYVVPADGAAIEDEALRTYLARLLPDFMVPAAFVTLPELPVTERGKVDRSALSKAERTDRRSPEATASTAAAEELLLRIWAEVLSIETVGTGDDFFGSGGDSMAAIRLVAGAARHDLHFTLRDVFEHSTVAALAAVARDTAAEPQLGEKTSTEGFTCRPSSE